MKALWIILILLLMFSGSVFATELKWQLRDLDQSIRGRLVFTGQNFLRTGQGQSPYFTWNEIMNVPGVWNRRASYEIYVEIVPTDLQRDAVWNLFPLDYNISMSLEHLELPVLPRGTYYVYIYIRHESGRLLYTHRYILDQIAGIEAAHGWNTGNPVLQGGRFFAAPRQMVSHRRWVEIPFDVAPAPDQRLLLRVENHDFDLLHEEEVDIRTGLVELALDFPGTYFEITWQLFRGDLLLDSFVTLVGIREELPDPPVAAIPLSDVVSTHSNITAFDRHDWDNFATWAQTVVAAGHTPEILISWKDFEPLPGVYQFDYLEERLDYIEKLGTKAFLGFYPAMDQLPLWLWDQGQLDQDGSPRTSAGEGAAEGAYFFPPSPASTLYRESALKALTSLVQYFKGDPRVLGWVLLPGGIESILSDNATRGTLYDYSPFAQEAFQAYLEELHGEISIANAKYNANHSTWEEFSPPKPRWDITYNDDPLWLDFLRFKQELVVDHVLAQAQVVRVLDPTRPLYVYALLGTGVFEKISRELDPQTGFAFGAANSPLDQVFRSVTYWQRVPYRGESSYTPPQASSLDAMVYNAFAYGHFDSFNLVWNNRFQRVYGMDWVSEGMTTFDSIAKAAQILQDSQPHNSGLGAFFSFDSHIHRQGSFAFLDWGYRTGSQIAYLNLQEKLTCLWVTDYSPKELYDNISTLWIDYAPVINGEARKQILDFVAAGGNLIIGLDREDYLVTLRNLEGKVDLLRQLGLTGSLQWVFREDTATLDGVQLRMLNRVVTGAPGQVLARFSNGEPAVLELSYGQGKVLVLLGEVALASSGGLRNVLESWGGITPVVNTPARRLAVAARCSEDGYYVMAYYKPEDHGGREYSQAELDALPPVSSRLTLHNLPPGHYRVMEITTGQELGTYSTQALATTGLPVTLAPSQWTIYGVYPEE